MTPEFIKWWDNHGSGMRPASGEDVEEFAKFIAWQAWHRGTYVERKRCISTVREWIEAHNTPPKK